jgi:hypothetical protein
MRRLFVAVLLVTMAAGSVSAQVQISGRLFKERFPGSKDQMPLTACFGFAGLTGSAAEPHGFRTWETEPVGWYRFTGPAGNYT